MADTPFHPLVSLPGFSFPTEDCPQCLPLSPALQPSTRWLALAVGFGCGRAIRRSQAREWLLSDKAVLLWAPPPFSHLIPHLHSHCAHCTQALGICLNGRTGILPGSPDRVCRRAASLIYCNCSSDQLTLPPKIHMH